MKIKNEQGYALVTVLLITTIFMIIIISVMGQSANTMTQNQTIESKSQSTAIAEMGISYYQATVQNIYTKYKSQVNSDVQTIINNDRNANSLNDQDSYYSDKASSKMIGYIQQELNKVTPSPIDPPNPNPSFKITNTSTTIKTITLYITGYAKGDSVGKTLSTTITVSPKVTVVRGTAINGPLLSINLSLKVQPPTDLSRKCNISTIPILGTLLLDLNNLLNNTACKDVYFDGTLDVNKNTNSLSDNILYATSNLSLEKNDNSMTSVDLHAEGNLSIGQNLQNAQGVIIEAKNKVSFGQNADLTNYIPQYDTNNPINPCYPGSLSNPFSLSNPCKSIPSYLYVGIDLTVDQHFGLSNGSTAYVGGLLTAPKDITLSNGATAYIGANLTTTAQSLATGDLIITGGSMASIGGKATITGKLKIDSDPNSLLCIAVDSNLDVDSSKIDLEDGDRSKHIITLNSSLDLQQKCGFRTPNSDGFTWDDKITKSVDYNY